MIFLQINLEDLTINDILKGSLSLVFVIIAIIIGVRILTKYFSLKRKELITVGLTLIFLSSAWWGSAVSFVAYIFFGYSLNEFQFFLLGDAFIAIALISWIYSFTTLTYPEIKKPVLIIYFVIAIAYEIFLFSFLFIDPSVIGTIETFNSDHSIIPLIFLLFCILTFLITGILFSRESMKSTDPKVRLKGKFILVGMVSFCFGAIFDAGIPLESIWLILVRILLISSAIEYYIGFLLPKKLSDFFLT
ncbi:MAG: conserved membrane protein of unknown function [Promethearchaeota archaeon]|nr:MAG: conserved membrane protein of unknown function [Candidatus Lokiarchaeota archaeon]